MSTLGSLTRRRLLGVALSAPLAGLLAACGGSASTNTSSSSSTGATTTATSATQANATPIQSSGVAPTSYTSTPGTTPSAVASGPVANVSFTVVDGTEPPSLDPPVGTGPFQHIINAMFERLVAWTPQMQAQPALATNWEVSADHKQWTFKLRPGVKFHDGTPFNSAAVKATIAHILDPNTKSTRRASYALIKEVQTPDDLTAVFVTDPVTPDFPFLMADGSASVISPTALQKLGATGFGRHPVGTGPFKFQEWVPNDHITATINPDYWGPKPLVERFVYKPVPEVSTRNIVLKSGEADVVFHIAPNDVAQLKTASGVKIISNPSLTITEIQLKQTKKPMSDKRVRQALNMAVDKDAIIKNVMFGFAQPLKTPDIPGLWGAFEFDQLPYDPNKAKQLLTQAGYPNGFDLTFNYVSGRWPGDDQTALAVQGYWAQIGVKAKIDKSDEATFDANLSDDPNQNPLMVIMPERSSLYSDYQLFRMYQSSATHASAAQRSGYSNPQVDKLLAEEESEFDPNKRLPIFKQVEQLIWNDQPFVYLFTQVNIYGQRDNVSGFSVLPSGDMIPGQIKKG